MGLLASRSAMKRVPESSGYGLKYIADSAGSRSLMEYGRSFHGIGSALHAAGIADVGALVVSRIGVENFAIVTRAAALRHGTPSRTTGVKLQTTTTKSSRFLARRMKAKHARGRIVGFNPFKARTIRNPLR